MKKTFLALCLTLGGMSVAQAALLPFDISLSFGAGLSPSQKAVFSQAEAFWESKITGYTHPVTFPTGLRISASSTNKDGVGGILGSAGPTTAYTHSNLYYASAGQMSFDSADIAWLEQNGRLFEVIVHEMAHVIGYGTLWSLNGLYVSNSGQYTGSYALAAYRAEFDPTATYIPVELDGGPGTANGHWDEAWDGGSGDLMTGYLDPSTYLSNTTLMSFRDLGYNVVESVTSNPVSVGFALSGAFLLLVGASSRKRK